MQCNSNTRLRSVLVLTVLEEDRQIWQPAAIVAWYCWTHGGGATFKKGSDSLPKKIS